MDKSIKRTKAFPDVNSGEVENEMVRYWNEGFAKKEKDGQAFYALSKLPQVTQASHHRRIELLASLPIGDVSDKVCVDYGVGPWGFGCVFPRLQECRYAIGIDISEQAIRMSEEISRTGNFPYGQNFRYLTSLGNKIDLEDASVDIFFAGEAIEHVDDVVAFLDEAHRILKPEGLIILTTPNADAYLYKIHNERYCFNAEHISLMSFSELQSYIVQSFEIVVAKGFNGTFYRTLDEKITDPQIISEWVNNFEDRPELASGVIVMARKRVDYQPHTYMHRYYNHASPAIQYQGKWEVCELYGPMTGTRGHPDSGSQLSLEFEGDGLLIDLWGHDWSGFARLEVDGIIKTVNLYSPVAGFHKVRFSDLGPGRHKLTIAALHEKDIRSLDYQIILWRVISYVLDNDHTEYIPPQNEQPPQDKSVQEQRAPIYQAPDHLLSIFEAPAEQLLPERLLIYTLILSLQPENCLEIGTHWGGSASIICAAMDDVGCGHLTCVDPQPLIGPETWDRIKHRINLIQGMSPDILPQALEQSGSPFDFALIDGDHTYYGVVKDVEGVLPCLADEAYLIFHDSHYFEIDNAINEVLRRHASQLRDCGNLSVLANSEDREVNGRPVQWGGLRLLRFNRNYNASILGQNQMMPEQIQELQAQLRFSHQKLQLIENTRTWQFSSRLAYSRPGRLLSRLIRPFLR